eukprot:5187751-Ditylum_brightwellii.AAC.1
MFNSGGIEVIKETTLETYPVAVLDIGDMEWQAFALDKENFSSCHCNHCQQKQILFGNGASEPWSLQKLQKAAGICQ